MNVRIISGEFGGRKIDAPSGRRMHPMGERIRNALFNSLVGQLAGTDVLDAFAGTGAIGIEALSRGAARATFIEKDRLVQHILAKNITSLGLEQRATIIRTTVHNWLTTAEPATFDVIFADPPYHDPQLSTVQQLFRLLKPNGLMLLSHPGKGEVLTENGIVVVDNRSYGNAYLTLYRREDA